MSRRPQKQGRSAAVLIGEGGKTLFKEDETNTLERVVNEGWLMRHTT
jgi:hypothetical protein